jgi:uncharacterized membrane protein
MSDVGETRALPSHIEETIKTIGRLQAEHYRQASPLQKIINRATARAATPEFIGALAVIVIAWVLLNGVLQMLGDRPLDQPPFFWMQGVVGMAALVMTTLVLITQRHDDQLANHRDQLTLELGILSEQRSAKIIQLLEELRRDTPSLRDRIDHEAAAMSAPADPQAVLDAIKETQRTARASKEPPTI